MKKNILVIVLMVMSGVTSVAQTLTLQECREMALQYNKDRKSAALAVEQAQYTRKSVKAMFFPDFSLEGFGAFSNGSGGLGYDITGVKAGLGDIAGFAYQHNIINQDQYTSLTQRIGSLPNNVDIVKYKIDWVYGGSVVMKQPIYMGGKIFAGYNKSKYAVELYKQLQRKTDADVLEEVDQAYATLVKTNELLAVAQKYQELLSELDKNVESAVKHGMRLQNDRMKVQVKLNEVQLQIRRAENGIRLATMNLCHVIGQPLNSKIQVSKEYPRVDDAMTLQTMDVSARPEYAVLDYQANIAKEDIKSVRSDMLPHIALLAQYGYVGGVKVNGRRLLDSWNFAGGVTVSVPLYHFGEHTNKLKAAKVKYQQAVLDKENKTEMMLLQLSQTANNLDESQLECQLAEKSLLEAENSMNISHKMYLAGSETLSDYLESQATWQKAYETRVNSYFQRYLASVKYLKAAGTLTSGM